MTPSGSPSSTAGRSGRRPGRSRDLAQPPGLYLVDEPTDAVLVWNKRAMPDARDRLAHVLLQIGEGLHGEMWLDARFLLDLLPELVVCEGEDRKSTRLNSSHANISYAVF